MINPLATLLYPYQLAYVLDQSRFKAWNASRQIGKSTAIAFESVLYALLGENSYILSYNQKASKEVMRKVHAVAKVLCSACGGGITFTTTLQSIVFSNGAVIEALPGKPDSARGYSGNVFVDEFCIIERPDEIWRACIPIITNELSGRKYKFRVSSTPKGKNHRFYDIMTNKDNEYSAWSLHETSVHDAKRQGMPIDIEAIRKAMNDPDGFAQEYELHWLESVAQLLSRDLVESCFHGDCTLDPGYWETTQDRRYTGFDVGRHRDLSVSWVLRNRSDVLFTEEVLVMEQTPFDIQQSLVGERIRLSTKTVLDATGMGEETGERLQTRWGEGAVEALRLTMETKNMVFGGLKSRMQRGIIKIPANRIILDDLCSLEKQVTDQGNVRILAARTKDGHADRANALALAAHATTLPSDVIPKGVQPSRARPSRPAIAAEGFEVGAC